jgi:undecaprenyl-diphosphatase
MRENRFMAQIAAVRPAPEPDDDRARTVLVPDLERTEPGPPRWGRAAAVGIGGYCVLTIAMLAMGFTLTHALEGSVGGWDEHVNRWFADHRTETWNQITGTATWFVNTVPAIGIAAVICAVLALRRRWREATMLVLALVLELAVFLSVTWIIDRPRPDVVRLDATPSTASFPSGHTAAATVLFAGLAIIITCCTRNTAIRVAFYVLAVTVAVLIGFARVYRGMHHPSDVMVGAVLGAGSLLVAVLTVRASAPRGVKSTGETAPRPARPNVAPANVHANDPS